MVNKLLSGEKHQRNLLSFGKKLAFLKLSRQFSLKVEFNILENIWKYLISSKIKIE